jgi:hypothetical protein
MKWVPLIILVTAVTAFGQFHVPPYVQFPTSDAMMVLWLSPTNAPGHLVCRRAADDASVFSFDTHPRRAEALGYVKMEVDQYFGGDDPPLPYQHEVRIAGLTPDTLYRYTVAQGAATFEGTFRTAPGRDTPVRLIAYADCETQPSSTGDAVEWPTPEGDTRRRYPIDQTTGYANNLAVIRSREPNLILIAGDIVQYGNRQLHWDEFWKHNTNLDPALSTAGSIPILPALGNHDYVYDQFFGFAVDDASANRYLTYFRVPDSGVSPPEYRGRFYRLDYGPVSIIALDLNNGRPHRTDRDTNFMLQSVEEGGRAHVPDFHEGSVQHAWLTQQLADAQQRSRFTIVLFHHAPYSMGPHAYPAGMGNGYNTSSGIPARALTPLFMKYGVDAVISGHDEMMARSMVEGHEQIVDGAMRPHTIQFYDVGIGGDGLRAPSPGIDNPYLQFLAHRDAPEVWQDGKLIEGGKHYGHLEIDVAPDGDKWKATLTPVYVLPTDDGFERRTYRDVVTLVGD